MAMNKKDERGKKRRASKVVSTSKVKTQKTNSKLKISKIQDLQLKVIGLTSHDNCDGKKIEKILRQNHNLWHSVVMPNNQLYPLRDMEYGVWSADTLYVLVREGKESELEQLVKRRLRADVVTWIGSDSTMELLGYWKKDEVYNPKLILSAWWDL